jgi:hypothetical protein
LLQRVQVVVLLSQLYGKLQQLMPVKKQKDQPAT